MPNKFPPTDAKGLTTPFGMLRYAEEYRRAAELVHQQDDLLMPANNLLGLTYELATKAYLLGRGMSVEVLSRRPYGHDLEELWREATRLRIDRLVALAPLIGDVVTALNIHYKTHEFRYIKTGTKTVPHWQFAAPAAKALTHSLHDYCLRMRIGKAAAKQRIALKGRF